MRDIFSSLLGNAYLRKTLAPDLAEGRAAHGYILSGPCGSGKKTAARLMAAASVCENRLSDTMPLPCGTCPSCHRILHDLSADVLWITHDDRASIGVDQIRAIRENLYVSPNDGERKFYIIDEAHTMTAQAQNALLLSLEEPPEFVTFLLLTEDPSSLLETIRSRAPVIHMELFPPATVRDWLKTQALPKTVLDDTERCDGAAVLSGGALGQALVLVGEDSAVLQMRALTLQLLEGIFRLRPSVLLEEILPQLPTNRGQICQVLTMLQSALRDLIARKRQAAVDGQFLLGNESVCRYAGRFSVSRLMSLYDLCSTTLSRLDANGSISPCMTSFLLQAKHICH